MYAIGIKVDELDEFVGLGRVYHEPVRRRSNVQLTRCSGGSSLEHDSPADPKMGAVAAVLVENGPRTTIVALNRG